MKGFPRLLQRLAPIAALLVFAAHARAESPAAPPDFSWDLAVLERLLTTLEPDGSASAGCVELRGWQVRGFRDAVRRLAAQAPPDFAVQSPVVLWPGGVVPYVFDASVTTAQRRSFADAAADWVAVAAVSFVARTAQTNYILVRSVAGLGGGQSAVGVTGPAQTFDIGVGSWNRGTLLHEMGHTLGLVHEHQRPDRNAFVTIQTANILPGQEANFTVLPATTTGAYDFLSVMHYRRDSFSTGAGLDTIVPKPGYETFLNVMGNQYDRPQSTLDRAGLAATYGAGVAPASVVTNTRDGGPGSLTAALYRAVDAPGTTITFNIPTSDSGYEAATGTWTIRPTDQLPKLGRLTTLDATTQPGGAATGPKIVLDGAFTTELVDVFAHGLELTENGCVVRGFAIRDFDGDAIRITGPAATDNVVTRCHLGCNAAGNAGAAAGLSGLSLYNGAQRNRIGGPAASDRNIISGSRDVGLRLSGVADNLIQGNFIGLRPDGATALANLFSGVQIDSGASANVLRGNVISGNTHYGVAILGLNATANRLEGNLIGTNAGGTAAAPNQWTGVGIFSGATGNFVGGGAGRGNLVSGNGNSGVVLSGAGATGNLVSGNFIGTDLTGALAVGNGWSGLQIDGGASQNTVGGTAPGAGNVISGNLNYGAAVFGAGSNDNVFAANLVGLNAAGTGALGNAWSGLGFFSGASGNLVGGSPAARNFISANANNGVAIGGAGTNGNRLHGNTIGFDLTGVAPRGNSWEGVSIYGGAAGNQIGGLAAGAGNRIGANGIRGVVLFDAATVGNAILGNSIAANVDVGIDLFTGANLDAPAPVLNSAMLGLQTFVALGLSAQPSTTYRVEFFATSSADGSSFGEGAVFLGAQNVTTDAGGSAIANVALPVTLPAATWITATATSPANNTSRFSNVAFATMTDSDGDGLPDVWEFVFGLDPGSAADAALDRDGDGFSNTAEYLAGTDPQQPASRPAPPVLMASGADLQVLFTAVSRWPFRLEKSADLVTWRIWADNQLGSGAAQSFSDAAALPGPRQFYRARFGF